MLRALLTAAALALATGATLAADLGPRITTTDGASYVRAADGHYYPAAHVTAAGAVATAPAVRSAAGACPGGSCAAPVLWQSGPGALGSTPWRSGPIALPAAPAQSCPGGKCPTGFAPEQLSPFKKK